MASTSSPNPNLGERGERACKTCKAVKDISHFEKTTKTGRRSVCKPCYAHIKKERAAARNKTIDRNSVPKPTACSECGRGEPDVTFKWRTDIASGGWRSMCNSCFNDKGYYTQYRARQREIDEEAYLARNAATHLDWARRNPDKVQAQKVLEKTDPTRKFKALVQYVKSKYGEEDVESKIVFADSEALEAKMTEPCAYCGHAPQPGDVLNGLDRVDPCGQYSDTNTVSCCGLCNGMKLTFSTDEFLQGVRDIVAHRGLTLESLKDVQRPAALGGTLERRESTKDKTESFSKEVKVGLLADSCYLCGRAPALGIDRVDASKPYEEGNCAGCCTICNYMKKDYKLDEFLGHVARINEHTKLWVLKDVTSVLSNVMGQRKPVAPVDMRIIFPSASCASLSIGRRGHAVKDAIAKGESWAGTKWKYVAVEEYKAQTTDQAAIRRILLGLIDSNRNYSRNS